MATLQFTEGASSPPQPINHQKQLLVNVVDGMARTRPEALYAEIPASYTSYDQGYLKVTYKKLANAVNTIAWLLEVALGRGQNFPTLAYIGPIDISYVIVILGAVKAGYKKTSCHTLLTLAPPYSATGTSVLEAQNLRVLHVPSVYELLESISDHYPYTKTFVEAEEEPLVVVHTSGTTSTPKPVVYTHGFTAAYTQWISAPAPEEYKNIVTFVQSNRCFVTLPFFHAGCLYSTMFDALTNQTTVVTPLGGVTPSVKLIVEALSHVEVDAIIFAAPFLEQIAKDQKMFNFVTSKVKIIAYGGGDVSKDCGDSFARNLVIFNFNGSTETSTFPALKPIKETHSHDWKYIHPHPAAGLEFRPYQGTDGLYELFVVRNPDPNSLQPVFQLFKDKSEWATRDLWAPHANKQGSWVYRGRSDDMIVFKAGWVYNPTHFEQDLARLNGIKSALVIGTGRNQLALLLEPEYHDGQSKSIGRNDLVDEIWDYVQEANDLYGQDFRITKTHILCTQLNRPMKRSGKGTIQRTASLVEYEREIDQLYEEMGDSAEVNERPARLLIPMASALEN